MVKTPGQFTLLGLGRGPEPERRGRTRSGEASGPTVQKSRFGQQEVLISICSALCDTSWTNVRARPFAIVSCPVTRMCVRR